MPTPRCDAAASAKKTDADGVERRVEGMTGGFRLAVGPEEREEPVPAYAPAAGRRDNGQQREPTALSRRTGVQLAVLMKDQPVTVEIPRYTINHASEIKR